MLNEVDNLAPMAIALVSLVILVSTGAIVLTQMESTSYIDKTITDEQDQPSTPLPTNYTLDASTNQDYVQIVDGSVEVVLEDSSSNTNTTLTEDTDYVVYYEDGKIEVQSSPGGVSYNTSEGDKVYTTYDYEEETTGTSTLSKGQDALSTFGDFFQVIVVVGVAAVIFLLLGALRRTGAKTMA